MSDKHQIRLTLTKCDQEELSDWEANLKQLAMALQREFKDKVGSVESTIIPLNVDDKQKAGAVARKIEDYLVSPRSSNILKGLGGLRLLSMGRDEEHPSTENRFSECFTFVFR